MIVAMESLIERAAAAGVRLVRVTYCDNANLIRAKAVPVGGLDAAARYGVGFSVAQQALPMMYDTVLGESGLTPAGEAWQWAWAADSTLPLYSTDDFHPTPMGTYLAALTLFERLYDHTPVGIQETAVVNGRVQGWPAATVHLLQEAAATANAAEDNRILARRR